MTLLAAAMGCLATGAVAASPYPESGTAGAWEIYRSSGGRFSVLLPDSPVISRDSRWSPFGRIDQARYTLKRDGTTIALEHHDLPHIATMVLPVSTILNRARNSLVEDMHGEVLESRDGTRNGLPVREVSYAIPGSEGLMERALIQLVGDRLYVMVVTLPRTRAQDPAVAQIFSSFEVWRP